LKPHEIAPANLKLVRMPDDMGSVLVNVIISQIEGASCVLPFHYCPACLNVFVSRVVQTWLPKFGTLLAHILPQGTLVDALE
jgi:hypothetical protein